MELSLKDLDPNEMSLMTVVRISDLAMRRIIAMAKKLSTFMSIRQEDQIALLKGLVAKRTLFYASTMALADVSVK